MFSPQWTAGAVEVINGGSVSAGTLFVNGTSSASEWNAGSVSALGSNLSISGTTLEVALEWNAGAVEVIAGGSVSAGTLFVNGTSSASEWTAGSVSAVGSGLSINSGTLEATAPSSQSLLMELKSTSPGTNGTAAAFGSCIMVTTAQTVITSLSFAYEALVNGGTYEAMIAAIGTAGTITAIEATSSTYVSTGTAGTTINFPFSNPVTLAAGTYGFMTGRIDSTGTYALPYFYDSTGGAVIPIGPNFATGTVTTAHYATTTPGAGTSPTGSPGSNSPPLMQIYGVP